MIELKENDLYFAKVNPDAIIPTKEKENAGYDIYACFDKDFFIGDIVGVQDEYFNFSLTPRILKYTISQDAKGKYTEAIDYGD